MQIQTITAEQAAEWRQICNAAQAYAESIMTEGTGKRRRNYLTKEEAAAPIYAACSNEMRGAVEQFELLAELPERFCAYLESGGSDRIGASLAVSVWTGRPIGTATVESAWRIGGYVSSHMRSGRAMIGGVAYSWRGCGAGMIASFRRLKRQPAPPRSELESARFSYRWPPSDDPRRPWRVALYKGLWRVSPTVYRPDSFSDHRTLKAACRRLASAIHNNGKDSRFKWDCLYIISPDGRRLPLKAARQMLANHGVPIEWPVKPIAAGSAEAEQAADLATCGGCGRSWDDGVSTSMTPAPSGRCPFEPFHAGVC